MCPRIPQGMAAFAGSRFARRTAIKFSRAADITQYLQNRRARLTSPAIDGKVGDRGPIAVRPDPRPLPVWLTDLNREIVACRRCPRLVAYREQIAREKRRAYIAWEYWGKPVPGFGDPEARVIVLGLAPGAHGSNRTGRPFTGDASGNFMYPILYKMGFASQPTALRRDDGLKLIDCYITAAVRCAPPDNKPLPSELMNCSAYLDRELAILRSVRVVVALGKIGFDAYLAHLRRTGVIGSRSG